ncbi:MAG: PD40 domain-containing protein [Candidatus Nealsonbacteria bacterium]|nr:PD40 domain-containing protein [Candidatus Nealsonbacteria bacterium]
MYLNGLSVGESKVDNNAWKSPLRFDVTRLLVPGRNVVAIEAVNTLPGPAGLIVKLVVRLADGRQIVFVSDATWRYDGKERPNWQQPNFDDAHWRAAHIVGEYGAAPWNKIAVAAKVQPAGGAVGKVHEAGRRALMQAVKQGWTGAIVEETPPPDYAWPGAIAFVSEDCSLYRPLQPARGAADSLTVTIFNPRKSRSFPEHDLPAPMKVGRKLCVLSPARPGVKPRVLCDAGRGAIGSPSVSFDGKWIYVSMARDGDPLFHIYRLPAAGGPPQQLSDGPFHDIDPAELPDGRIVFTSTRARAIVPHLIRSVPVDPEASPVAELTAAISATHRCWGGHPGPENRAAQILSMVCRDGKYEPRIRAALLRYRAKKTDIPRVFDTGIPVVLKLPLKHWVCFFLARTLGNLADPQSTDTLIAALEQEPPEAATGRPDPLGSGVLFLHNDLTPCWRAAVAWAVGQIGERRATGALLGVVGDLKNAHVTRPQKPSAASPIRPPRSRSATSRPTTRRSPRAARCCSPASVANVGAEPPRAGGRTRLGVSVCHGGPECSSARK